MTIRILAASAILLMIVSCKKENPVIANPEKLSEISLTDPSTNVTGTSHYLYNSNEQLTEIVATNNQQTNDTTRQVFSYNLSGYLSSFLITNNTSGDQFKYDFTADANGRILAATGTAFQPNMLVTDIKYVYDAVGRITSDSLYLPSGELYGYNVLEYDINDNVAGFQQFVKTSAGISTQGKFTCDYDNKKSPFGKIGLLLYTVSAASDSYFYLTKNNATAVFLNGNVFTPGGHFVYQYYNNELLRTSKVNVSNSLLQEFFYR